MILSVTIIQLLSLSLIIKFWRNEAPLEFVQLKTWTPISISPSGIRAVADTDDDVDVNVYVVID